MAREVHAAQAAVTAAIGLREGDQIVVGCGRFSVEAVGFEWSGAHRLVFRGGRDGADLELVDILETERVGERFTEIVLVSGDGIFAEIVSVLQLTTSAEVTVVSRMEACSRRLRMAAKHVVHLDFDAYTFMEVA